MVKVGYISQNIVSTQRAEKAQKIGVVHSVDYGTNKVRD